MSDEQEELELRGNPRESVPDEVEAPTPFDGRQVESML